MKMLLATLLLIGCEKDEQQGPMGPTFAQATGSDRCEALVAAFCDRCDDSTFWTYDECLDQPEIDVDCEDTINLGSKYEDCMEAIEEGQCADALPSECIGIVIVDY